MSDESDWNARIIEEFRANEGKLGGMFEGADMLLLHHTGSKSGIERVNPSATSASAKAYAVFGSNSGKTSHPAWLHNLRVHPQTTAEIGTETIEVVARVAEGDERAAIWGRQKASIPQFADYEEMANRDIPIVILEPVVGS